MGLREEYICRYDTHLKSIASKILEKLTIELEGIPRIDRITARVKDPDSFLKKSLKKEDDSPRYTDPLIQIQDQIGIRVIAYFLEDVKAIQSEIEEYYRLIEKKKLIPESENEFGYIGEHYVLMIPEDAIEDGVDRSNIPGFFELQIKTLFQHAWSEANHDLGYKPEQALTSLQKRKLAFTAAQAWGADQIFSELLNVYTVTDAS